ncbi:hypothetical protein ILYODFUR_011925 [Ilyodon furcidens]|uniref:Uncharacterized protein n=1 Tax=Ilyodon furcidens TaxID=33524 RepID=A0ABV0VD92_9TELE
MTVCNWKVTCLAGVRLFPSAERSCVATSLIQVIRSKIWKYEYVHTWLFISMLPCDGLVMATCPGFTPPLNRRR